MSQFVELAAKLQEQQIEAVKQSQDAFLRLVAAMPQAPAVQQVEVPEQVREAMQPAYDFFGTPEEVQAFLTDAAKTWAQIGQDFQNEVLDRFAAQAADAAAEAEKAAKA